MVGADPAASGGKTSRLGAVKSFVGGGDGAVGSAFKSVGGAAANTLRAGAKLLTSPVGALGAAGYGVYQGLNTDTDQYAKRFGLESTEPGFLRDVGVRALGVASDIGDGLLVGAPQAFGAFRDKNEPPPTPDAPTTSTLRTPTAFAPTQTTRSARDLPGASGETLRGAFGNFSPAGTFADGFTDMGGGIARNGSSFTNIGANGLPTAMSGRDTRTPDQIANGERINAETARVVAEAGGLGNLQRQNALTAANLRDQNSGAMNFGGMTALGTGMRGNMRVSDSAGSDRDTGSMADMVRRSGVRMTPATLRQAMQGDIQLRVNAESNETSRANNAASNAASLRTATMTNETSRTNNQDSNRTSEANNLRSNATQLETAALPARLQLQAGQQKRAAVSEALRLSGGDQAAAAQALSAAGYTDVAKDLVDQASAEQAAAKGAVEFNRNLTAASSVVTDDKGNEVVSPARQAVNASALRQMVSNYDQLTPREKVAAEAQYRPALNILNGMNDRREDTLFKKFGWDQAPAHTTLPDGLRGAHLEAVGPWEGMMTSGAERGDYALRLPDKTTRYINAGRISQAEKQFLKERGVTLGEK